MIGAVLSGGENTRMPVLKGLLSVEGKTIIERSLDVLRKFFDKVVISTNMPETYFRFGACMIGDIKKERGPMTGILSTLVATGDDAVFVVACDMPFVNEDLVRHIVGIYSMQKNSSELRTPSSELKELDAVIPVFNGKYEPLFGIYTKNAVSAMEDAIDRGENSIYALLKKINVLYIDEKEVRKSDPDGRSFVNINTMGDYEKIGGRTCSV